MNVESQDLKQNAIKDWVHLYSDGLYSWALTKVSSVEMAEDLVQETFMAAFATFDKFENKSKPKTWLFSILNHKIIDHYRKKNNAHQSLDQLTELKATQYTDSLFDKNGNWNSMEINSLWASEPHLLDDPIFNNALKLCMANLPEKWSNAIHAKYLLEKKPDEICHELELSTTNYWQILHRAKLLLKKCIENRWNP